MRQYLAAALLALGVIAGASASDDPQHGLPNLKPGATDPIGIIGSPGEPVELEPYAVAGKTTIFDFYSKYCPPCRKIAPELEKLVKDRADVVVRQIDINRPDVQGIDWKSPVAAQYQLQGVPHFKIYGPDGKLKVEGDEAYEQVSGYISKKGD